MSTTQSTSGEAVETVEVSGHIIDSLILPKILDLITASGAAFNIKEISVGQARSDPSFALVEIHAPNEQRLAEILETIGDHGAVPTQSQDARLVTADIAGTFPEGFYSTTNQRTEVRLSGNWMPVADQEMDCGIVVGDGNIARCIPMTAVAQGDLVVVGHAGVRVFPPERTSAAHSFEFMNSAVSTEKPKGVAIRQIARQLFEAKQSGSSAIVGGPAIVHTGSGEHLCQMIRRGYVDCLLAGNALAAHDIEQSMFGTSLGVRLDRGDIVEAGHEHHLRAINRVRRAGSIAQAVEAGALTSGIMFECVKP